MYKWTLGAACILAAAPLAFAGSDDDALLEQVKLQASKGQDSQTSMQVDQYVEENRDIITAILKGYTDYLKRIEEMTNDGVATSAQGQTALASGTGGINNESSGSSAQAAASSQASASDSSTGLQITGVQASGALQTAHLRGYPSLPDVDPASSITQLTAAQAEYAARVQKEMQARKAYLMEHPEGYTY